MRYTGRSYHSSVDSPWYPSRHLRNTQGHPCLHTHQFTYPLWPGAFDHAISSAAVARLHCGQFAHITSAKSNCATINALSRMFFIVTAYLVSLPAYWLVSYIWSGTHVVHYPHRELAESK